MPWNWMIICMMMGMIIHHLMSHEDIASGGQSLEFQQHSEAPPCAISEEVPEISFGIHHINWPFDRLLLYSNKNQEGGRESFLMTPPCCQMRKNLSYNSC
ncbi:hypothetical protein ACOSP7_023885 [Xanthoceras sorbifolium]